VRVSASINTIVKMHHAKWYLAQTIQMFPNAANAP